MNMKQLWAIPLFFALISAASADAPSIAITRSGSQPAAKGPAANFTGSVVVQPLFAPSAGRRSGGAFVTFEPGARSAWHSHPAGQTLVVTAGTGWVQQWGGKKRVFKQGDIIWTPPGVKHWHGATTTNPMTHLAIHEAINGKVVDWMEHVTEQQYRQ
jgi:quercetin dioxygenase-like cupin family protein